MMKHVLAAAISSAALLLASGALADGGPEPPPPPPPVYEPPPPPVYNWYTTVFGGVAFGGDLEQDVFIRDDVDPGLDEFFSIETPLKTGYLLGWTIGYRPMGLFGDWFAVRPEVELSFRQRDVDFEEIFGFDDDFNNFIINGDGPFDNFSDPADVLSLLFNGWIDFNFMGVQPYIGGGIGVGWADMPTPGSFLPHFESTDFVWQVGGGINFDVSDRVFVGVGYRWFNGGFEKDTRFIIAGPIGEPVDTIIDLEQTINIDFDYDAHEVLFNLGVRF
jgi:opacity protein-like surface antigen